MGEVALATAAIAAARSIGPTMTNPNGALRPMVLGGSAAVGAVAGLAGEGIARGVDAATPLDRFQSHVAVGVAGLGVALVGWRLHATPAKIASSAGIALATTGGIGVALDAAHGAFDQDGDGHFLPALPTIAKIGIGAAAVVGVGATGGRKLVTLLRNKRLLAGSAEQMDALGKGLNELIPRSKLTTGPQVFLGSRITDGHGASAIRTVVPHRLDAPELRASLGLPATGKLTADQRAMIGLRSFEQQGAFALDDAGKPVVDLIIEGSPTGMGGLNAAPIMMSEQLVRTATIDAQYGAKPSVQSLDKVDEALDAFIATSKAIKARVEQMPEGARPTRIGFATSLGGLQFDTLLKQHGTGILDELGLSKIITLGAPIRLSKLDPSTLPEGFHVRATLDEFAAMSEEQIAKARFVELRHVDDPVPRMAVNLLWQRPEWMSKDRRWTPGVSLMQHVSDVTTSIARGSGDMASPIGHDYRSAKSNAAFARAIGIRHADGTAFTSSEIGTAAQRAQDTAVRESKRINDILKGRKPAPSP